MFRIRLQPPWPEDLPLNPVEDMDVQALEKAFTWAVKFVAKYDPHAMVRRLALSDAMEVSEATLNLTSEGRYNIAMRLFRGVLGEPGIHTLLFIHGYTLRCCMPLDYLLSSQNGNISNWS